MEVINFGEVLSWQVFFTGCALFLVFEGILPFLAPKLWRHTMLHLLAHSDKVLRSVGLVNMVIGVGVLYLIRWLSA